LIGAKEAAGELMAKLSPVELALDAMASCVMSAAVCNKLTIPA